MAWTAPRTWVTGEVVTAAQLNTHVRDNLLETAPATVTTAGDVVYADGANSLARLGIGTARQGLLTNAGATAPEWATSMQSLLTAQGDVIYASAANTPARLAKGTAFQSLRMNGGATAPEWAPNPTIIYKSADETINGSDTLQDDDDLVLSVAANETWLIHYVLFGTAAGDNSDLQLQLTFPTGCAGRWGIHGRDQSATTTSGDINAVSFDISSGIPVTGLISTSGAVLTIQVFALIEVGANAGSITLQWAQATSQAHDTTIKKYSYLMGWEI